MKEGEGRVIKVGKYTVAVRLPKPLVYDSAFPFKVGEKVYVKIKNGEGKAEVVITNKRSG
jgi:hypothetical protein